MTLETLASQGNTTASGSMAANILSRIPEIRKNFIKEVFTHYENADHRLEYVANIHGIEFINDSKATNVNATWFALESMNRPVIWIGGGINNGSDFRPISNLVKSKVKSIICLGKNNAEFREIFGRLDRPYTEADTMAEAVELAYYAGKKGDIVLLSPGCASFEQFRNYEERGTQFKQAVKLL
jgi:UDP-N-acetylmuramoylalanine--D-glutamate ligase